VLIVDDDAVSRLVSQHIVEGAGHQTTVADSAEAARTAIADCAAPVDIVLSDYLMPIETGLDLLESLETPPPFVLLTGIGEADELDDPRVSEVTRFLTKPVQSAELIDVLESVSRVSFTG